MNNNEFALNIKDLKLAARLSQASSKIDKYIILLNNKYGFSLTKTELSEVLKKSEQTIDRRIKEGIGIPAYSKSGKGVRASYIFPIYEVAEHLSENLIKIN